MRGNPVHAHAFQVVDRRAQADAGRDRRRSGFKLVRDYVVGRLFKSHRQDHVAAALERFHFFEQGRFSVENADAGRPAHLVGRESIKVAIEILHIHLHVRDRLRAVEQYGHTMLVRRGNHVLDRIDGAQRIGDMGDGNEPGMAVEQLAIFVEQQFPGVVARDHAQLRALFFAQHLPGHDVRMVLELGNDDFVAGPDERPAVSVHHQVQRIRGAACINYFARLLRVDKALDFDTCALISRRRGFRQIVHAAMDVGVLRRLVAHQAVDHLLRHLTAGGVVQVHQRFAVDLEFQDRKFGADALYVECAVRLDRMENGTAGVHAVSFVCVCSRTVLSNRSTRDLTGMRSMTWAANA